jgi:hypothetical protein
MAEFKLDRFKYNWRNTWQTSTEYNRDDIVRYGGKTYVCLISHTASAMFETDRDAVVPGSLPPLPAPKWIVMTDGATFVGEWNTGQSYKEGDIVIKDGSLYKCISMVMNSSNWANEETNWEVFLNHIDFVGSWAGGNTYAIGAIVKYSGNNYRCIEAHTAQAVIEDDIEKWELFHEGIEYRGVWQITLFILQMIL